MKLVSEKAADIFIRDKVIVKLKAENGKFLARKGESRLDMDFWTTNYQELEWELVSGHGGGVGKSQWLWTAWMVFTPICSLLCAAGLSQTMSKSVPVRVLITIVLAPVIWGLNASISLFLGCVGGLMSAAAQGG